MRVRFDDFVLDDRTIELRLADHPVHLSPKAFQVLEYLLRRRPQAVAKAELQSAVWPDVHVTESSLASVVTELRSALSDEKSQPRFIRTVHGFGYAFCGEATDEAVRPERPEAGPVYRLIWNRREIQLDEGENVLGRDRDAVAWVDSVTVSRRHARIVISGGEATIEDLGSRNGTFVRGRRTSGVERLVDRDEIRLGSVVMIFRAFQPADTESLPD